MSTEKTKKSKTVRTSKSPKYVLELAGDSKEVMYE